MVSFALVRSVVEEEVVFVFVEIEGGERFEYAGNVNLYREASDAKNTRKSHVMFFLIPPELAYNTTDFRKLTLLIFIREYKFS